MTEQIYTEGKIVVDSWGYDQTNIDYYLIVKRTKTMVDLQPIGQKRTETGWLCGECEPDPTVFLDPEKYPIRRRKVQVHNGEEVGIRVRSFSWGTLWDGRKRYWSSYH